MRQRLLAMTAVNFLIRFLHGRVARVQAAAWAEAVRSTPIGTLAWAIASARARLAGGVIVGRSHGSILLAHGPINAAESECRRR